MANIAALAEASKGELVNKIKALDVRRRAMAIKEKAKAPVQQVGFGLAAVAGGAAGGAIAGVKADVAKIPTDSIVGVVLALPCLLGAGDSGVDALAMSAYGMLAGSASRVTHDHTRAWREKRAAASGNTGASQIVTLQANIDALRANFK